MGNFIALLAHSDFEDRSDLVVGLKTAGYEVVGPDAWGSTSGPPDLVVLDGTAGEGQLAARVGAIRARDPAIPILLTGQERSEPRGSTSVENTLIGVREALGQMRAGKSEHIQQTFDRLVGRSAAMLRLAQTLVKVAGSAASTVLITGETGTGKSLAARCLHDASARRAAPFVNVACVSVPSPLFESELFGHERGAFTDAKELRRGLLEQAHQGTVFLDEIGDVDPSCQAKLLHFLDEHRFRRVGGNVDLAADVRVVAATNVDLGVAIRNHLFRQDLYYRLAVITVQIPPLRERKEDIAPLCQHYLRLFGLQFEKPLKTIEPDAMRVLEAYCWPGNVRELRNVLERAVLLCSGSTIDVDEIQLDARSLPPDSIELPPAGIKLEELERSFVEQALARCAGNRSQAAALLGITRDQMRYRVEKYRNAH